MRRAILLLFAGAAAFLAPAPPLHGQDHPDATRADPAHYTVELENEHVRVVRIRYAPGDASPMHSHRPGAYVFLTSGDARGTLPDGRVTENSWEPGGVEWVGRSAHAVVNQGVMPFEIVIVEPKSAAAGARGNGSGDVRSAVMAATDAIFAAAAALDIDALVAHYADQPHIDQGRIVSREDVRRTYAPIYASARELEFDRGRTTVHVLAPDAAVVVAEGSFRNVSGQGQQGGGHGAWTFVWKREGDLWRLHHSHQSIRPAGG